MRTGLAAEGHGESVAVVEDRRAGSQREEGEEVVVNEENEENAVPLVVVVDRPNRGASPA